MFDRLLQSYITELNIEGVKLQLQVATPSKKKIDNSVLGKFFLHEIDPEYLMERVRAELKIVKQIKSVDELKEIYNRWKKDRINIQHVQGYGWGEEGLKRAATVFCYVFLMKCLKRQKPLFDMLTNSLT